MRFLTSYIPSYYEYEVRRNICIYCRGFKHLCGRSVCPIVIKAKSKVELNKYLSSNVIFGSSPPSIFIGSWGYPKVYIGPLTPPIEDSDTSNMDPNRSWLYLDWNTILRYRFLLVRGKYRVDVKSAEKPIKYVDYLQELAMSLKPIDSEVNFEKKPDLKIKFLIRDAPHGPSEFIKKFMVVENAKVPRIVNKVIYDFDLKAVDAIWELYKGGLDNRYIMRIFSAGLLGLKGNRRFVPTEWSITAIDDILSRKLFKIIRRNPLINNYYLFGYSKLGNNIQILLTPTPWMFEVLEAWLLDLNVEPESDYEFWRGRSNYANKIGGAYYAARLPVLEYLYRIRKQAGAIVFLEVYREWIPIGVWRVREICREALSQKPLKFGELKEALNILRNRLKLPLNKWLSKSKIYNFILTQRKLL